MSISTFNGAALADASLSEEQVIKQSASHAKQIAQRSLSTQEAALFSRLLVTVERGRISPLSDIISDSEAALTSLSAATQKVIETLPDKYRSPAFCRAIDNAMALYKPESLLGQDISLSKEDHVLEVLEQAVGFFEINKRILTNRAIDGMNDSYWTDAKARLLKDYNWPVEYLVFKWIEAHSRQRENIDGIRPDYDSQCPLENTTLSWRDIDDALCECDEVDAYLASKIHSKKPEPALIP